MIGIIDVGGGMRGIYTSGIYDYLIDKNIKIDYCIGVSAGSANLITYVAGQKGRTRRFYYDYSYDKMYMGLSSFLRTGSLLNLDYIYSEISNKGGKDPLDYDAIMDSECIFTAVSTDAATGQPKYFGKNDLKNNDYYVLKATCALPLACRPVSVNGRKYFDGGVSDPIPYKKAFADGCDKVILCITKPVDYQKSRLPSLVKLLLARYPKTANMLLKMHDKYNNGIKELIELEKQGKALVIYPENCFGVDTLKKSKNGLEALYLEGYRDAEKIEKFITDSKA